MYKVALNADALCANLILKYFTLHTINTMFIFLHYYASTKYFGITPQTADSSVEDSVHLKVIASPKMLFDSSQSVTLTAHGTESLQSKGLMYEWKCRKCDYTTGTSI